MLFQCHWNTSAAAGYTLVPPIHTRPSLGDGTKVLVHPMEILEPSPGQDLEISVWPGNPSSRCLGQMDAHAQHPQPRWQIDIANRYHQEEKLKDASRRVVLEKSNHAYSRSTSRYLPSAA